MMGMSFSHLLILFVVILLFGARRLPELGESLGKGMRAFKKGLEGGEDEENPKLAQQSPAQAARLQQDSPVQPGLTGQASSSPSQATPTSANS